MIPFALNLREFTESFPVSGSIENLEVQTREGKIWFSKPMPEASLGLAVLYADPETMKWDNPQMLFVKDDLESLKPGEIRFINVSDKTVLV